MDEVLSHRRWDLNGIFAAHQKLMGSGGKMTRAAAFRQIAKESGRKEGTVAVNYYYVAKKRGAGTKAARKVAAKAGKRAKAAAPKKAGISATIYDAIQELIAGGKMKRSEAFRQHAKATGRKEGTVAVNFYYAAKNRGGGAEPAKRGPGRPRKVVAASHNGAGSSRIEAVLNSLADLVRAQEAEISSLRKDNERFAALRKLLAARVATVTAAAAVANDLKRTLRTYPAKSLRGTGCRLVLETTF